MMHRSSGGGFFSDRKRSDVATDQTSKMEIQSFVFYIKKNLSSVPCMDVIYVQG
jgi:hypothetical protein